MVLSGAGADIMLTNETPPGLVHRPHVCTGTTPFYLGLNSAVIHSSFILNCPQLEDVYFLWKKPFLS